MRVLLRRVTTNNVSRACSTRRSLKKVINFNKYTGMLRRFSLVNQLLPLTLLLLVISSIAAASDYTNESIKAPSELQINVDQFENHRYIAVTLDLEKVKLVQEMINPQTNKNFGSFSQLRKSHRDQQKELLFAINSGIYTKEYTPLGLYIESGKVQAPLNRIKSNEGQGNFALLPNGVFFITDDNRAMILDTDRFDARFKGDYAGIRDAVQSGPMLLIEGQYNPYFIPNSDSYRIRSGVCTLREGRDVVFVVTEDKVNFHEFARYFKEELKCDNALYLDGTLARIFYDGSVYGASFWQAKPLVGIWSVTKQK